MIKKLKEKQTQYLKIFFLISIPEWCNLLDIEFDNTNVEKKMI